MRHRKVSRKLVSTTEHRIALLRNMVTDLLKHGKVTTTLAKAKELRRVADKMITLAKKGDLASRRRALGFIKDKSIVRKLFSELREKYLDRPGGYTRIVKVGPRRGDSSPMAIVELVEEKLSFRTSKPKKDRLRKVMEFIEKKRKELAVQSKTEEEKPEESKSEVSSQETSKEA